MSSLMYAAETRVISVADWKRLEAMIKMLKVSRKDKNTNDEVLKRANGRRTLKENFKKGGAGI